MFEVAYEATFCATHGLHRDGQPIEPQHGHDWRVEVVANHHKFGMSPNFAARWFEIDPSYPVIKVLSWLKIVDLGPAPQWARYPAREADAAA